MNEQMSKSGPVATWLINLPRPAKRILLLAVDVGLCVAAVWTSFYLRLGYWPNNNFDPWTPSIAAVLIGIPIFIRSGFYRAILRYTGLAAFSSFAVAITVFSIPYSALFTFYGLPQVPRTIGIIAPVMIFILIGGSRAFARLWLSDLYLSVLSKEETPSILIYGAGNAGRQLARALTASNEFRVRGFLDDDTKVQGATLNGLPIFPASDARNIIDRFGIRDVLLAIPSASRNRRMEVAKNLKEMAANVLTLPAVGDMARGKVSTNELKEVEIEDLLGRQAIPPDADLLAKTIAGKTVLVTGAGGSIGGELCRQIVAQKAAILLMLDVSEASLYEISQQLLHLRSAEVEIIPLTGSVSDISCISSILENWRPQTIFHAAAYKHVPLVEANLVEGAKNNVLGTKLMAEAASRYRVENFISISTDKAVRPTNAMGATKRLAEMILQQMNARPDNACTFSMVRFGNVLGSSGSVVPLFRNQIARGGPITVTDLKMTRFFMTIPEAAQLVIQAGAMARGGDVFLLDMGQPVKIAELAQNMVLLSGLTVKDERNPQGDIAIQEVGLRPGEKLFEELLIGDNPETTSHPRIFKANERMGDPVVLTDALADLSEFIQTRDAKKVRDILRNIVDEYEPNSPIADPTA